MEEEIKRAEQIALEHFASLEHIRWAKWQNYLHSFLTWNNEIQMWVLSHEKKDHWQMQINTPYQMLSEKEKESDREQVRPYLNWHKKSIKNLLEKEVDREEKELKDTLLEAQKGIVAGQATAGWNKAKRETISHLQQVIKSLE